MKIERGFWLSLTDQYRGKVIYQCATDELSDEEFSSLWALAGKQALRLMADSKDAQIEFLIRAQKLTS